MLHDWIRECDEQSQRYVAIEINTSPLLVLLSFFSILKVEEINDGVSIFMASAPEEDCRIDKQKCCNDISDTKNEMN